MPRQHPKNKILLVVAAGSLLLLTGGCFTGTTSTITEYSPDGKIVKVTQTGESVVKSITESTKDKTCITWESGWNAYLHATAATAESPTPTFRIGAGKVDKGKLTLHKDHKDFPVAEIIKATRSDLEVSTAGVTDKKQ